VVDELVEGVSVFGGVCCDTPVGGVNPAAVETALALGAKLVWLPTLTSRQDYLSGVAAKLGLPGPGISVVDAEGRLTPETQEVLALVADHGAVLATGHVSTEEHFAVARAARRRCQLLVTHATEELAGPNLSVEACRELAELGAYVELCAMTCIGALATRQPAELAACAAAVGPARCTLATDFGQAANPRPADGFQAFADALVEAGLSPAEVRTMACENPCRLLGIG
ncbi:MAG TPA: DUF6282 family protein, partial [Acidimicrobiales bacterium]|nr:DUF6282 family protein [Acidimicrobiales bacterium]